MTFVKEIKAGSREFCQNWLRYLLLFIGLSLFNQFIVIPLFRYVRKYWLNISTLFYLNTFSYLIFVY